MKYLNKLKEEFPEMYDKILHLAVNLNTLPRKEKRATQRKILKIIGKTRKEESCKTSLKK